ncbi:MAG: hypothetical protein IK096_06820 [Lachnospiraceae bacterium]|nr:hypothetical protein [Lachnospiraceae bacterium]
MTVAQRIENFVIGGVMLILGAALLSQDADAYPAIVSLYCLALELQGIRLIWYYFAMARHMVGGRSILYRGVLFINFGVFTGTLLSVPQIYILAYLTGTLAFSAVIDLLRANEARGIRGPWKLKTFQGAVKLLIALICLIFMHSPALVVDIFSVGFIFSALMRIVNACRRTPVITIS